MLSAMALCASSQVSAATRRTSLIPVSDTQAAMPATAPSTTASSFQLLPFLSMHACVHIYTHTDPSPSLEPQGIWHGAGEPRSGEGKDIK